MDRSPSTTIRYTKKNSVGAFPRDPKVLREVQAAARAAFPAVQGLVQVSSDRAYFQVFADPTHYSVAITPAEAVSLGFIKL